MLVFPSLSADSNAAMLVHEPPHIAERMFNIFNSSCCPLKITPVFKRQTEKKKSRFQYDRTRFCRSEMENVSCVFFSRDCGRKTVIG